MPRAQGAVQSCHCQNCRAANVLESTKQELATKISTAAELTAVREEMAAALAVESGKDAARTSLEAEKAARAIEQTSPRCCIPPSRDGRLDPNINVEAR